ncbi:type II toxin-antitoxin system HipA family toxin YjjJ [Niveibacterium sp. SC-1]|uniref:type II toxin-antitoxin system HipA family toxin YjjJ n=1 Tax=Niveibacterium sp. SC-1 TaxID=3135646 RepID=UPI00311D3900
MAELSDLFVVLRSGPLPAAALCERLGVSRPTLSRLVAAAGERVLRYGRARATSYALPRTVASQTRFPIFRIEADARVREIGRLEPVAPHGYLVSLTEHDAAEYFEGLPWWLQDMRPQGFLGRAFALREAGALRLPADLREWSDDDVLTALATTGDDWIGNLIVGDAALARYLNGPQAEPLQAEDRPQGFPILAAAALAGELPGSSAGGEHPKFATQIEEDGLIRPVLVKFSSAADNPVARRWASLLVAEHLALQTLAAAGLPASRSTLFEFGGQVFLQVERFDRVPAAASATNRPGRAGVVSLGALDSAFVGQANRPWPIITAALLAQGHITADAHRRTERLWAFGRLIGNSDMHGGNLAFLHTGSAVLELAPAYDMLPMTLAPRVSGEVPNVEPEVAIAAPAPLDAWREVLTLARDYWPRVAEDSRIEVSVRAIADRMSQRMAALAAQLG